MEIVLSPEVIGMFVFSGDFHGPPFTPPADRVDEDVGGWVGTGLGWDLS